MQKTKEDLTPPDQGLVLLDLQSQLAESGIMRKTQYAQDDGSRLTDAACRVIAEYMAAQFNEPQTNLSTPRDKGNWT